MRMQRLVRTLACYVWWGAVALVSSCAGDGAPAAGPLATVSARIGAAGGVLDLPDGGRLVVPAGALTTETLIEVTAPALPGARPAGPAYLLEPAGLEFLVPATLTIPWPADLELLDEVLPLVVYQASIRHDAIDAGSELSVIREARVVAVDMSARTLDVELDHFTFVFGMLAIDQVAYVVMDIPTKYLLPGDLFFTLTNLGDGPNWAPGHVGMYVPRQGFSNDVSNGRVVEATPPKVQVSTLADFRTESGHLYMGPRRPDGGLSPAERAAVTAFAEAQMHKPYAMILGQGNITSGSFSCVGLAEKALDAAGRGVLNLVQEALISTPLEMFSNTRPVREIVVYVGEEIVVPIYGVVVDPASWAKPRGAGRWTAYCACSYDMSAAVPAGASFTGPEPLGNSYAHHRRYRFSWVPEAQHANQVFTVPVQTFSYLRFAPDAPPRHTKIQLDELRISVLPLSGVTVPMLMLEAALADDLFPAGPYALSRIDGGRVVTGEAGCRDGAPHLHADGGGISIDGFGPLPDPNPSGCGYGLVVEVPVEHLR
jgi:hypothetical protein